MSSFRVRVDSMSMMGVSVSGPGRSSSLFRLLIHPVDITPFRAARLSRFFRMFLTLHACMHGACIFPASVRFLFTSFIKNIRRKYRLLRTVKQNEKRSSMEGQACKNVIRSARVSRGPQDWRRFAGWYTASCEHTAASL